MPKPGSTGSEGVSLPSWFSDSSAWDALADPLYRLRYGMTFPEKRQAVIQGKIPGIPAPKSEEDLLTAERQASAYLGGLNWPNAAPSVARAANLMRFWEWDEPELQNAAVREAERGSADYRKANPPIMRRLR